MPKVAICTIYTWRNSRFVKVVKDKIARSSPAGSVLMSYAKAVRVTKETQPPTITTQSGIDPTVGSRDSLSELDLPVSDNISNVSEDLNPDMDWRSVKYRRSVPTPNGSPSKKKKKSHVTEDNPPLDMTCATHTSWR